MDEIFKVSFFTDFYLDFLDKINFKEQGFLESLLKYNQYQDYLNLSEKQKSWYISIIQKYYEGKIIKGSVGEKMLKGKKLQDYPETTQKHILTYGDVFTINENIKKQLCIN